MRYRYLTFFILILLAVGTLFACSPKDEPAHVHAYGEWKTLKTATCTEAGSMERSCIDCGKRQTHKIEPLAHTLEKEVIAPTCDKAGYTVYSCQCGYSYEGDHTAPAGHYLKKTVYAASCTEQGYTHNLCNTCGYEFNSDFMPTLAHKNSQAQRYYATVRSSGYTQYTCSDCGHIYKEAFEKYSDIVSGAHVENTEVLKKGIDTSKWNHKVDDRNGGYLPLDWELIKSSGVDFVILRAGTSLGKDPVFDMDYEGAKAAGLEVGAYFYAYSTTVGGTVADALMLTQWLDGKQFEYPIYFDIEDDTLLGLTGEHLTEMCIAFGEVMQTHGYYSAIYANNEWLYNILNTETIKSLFDVWYARYSLDVKNDMEQFFTLDSEGFVWSEAQFGEQMGMWQFTQKGKIEGIDAAFDLNYSYKDYFPIMKKWGLNGF